MSASTPKRDTWTISATPRFGRFARLDLRVGITPFALFSLIGGLLVDRLDRRRPMLACDAVRFAIMVLFCIAYATHVLTLPLLYGGVVC